ncbi:DNA-binding protein [Paenibacillus mesotrionivorans]|uniref:DNA-binding protein n=1 Tax=Paenibacillus mesotrionivorans TaxID=3160968 RepID=A0ACC7P2S0_9BACL
MKQFNSSSILSSTIIGLSIVISSFIVAGVNGPDAVPVSNVNMPIVNKPLMNIAETAQYLNLTEKQVRTIISSEEQVLKATSSYEGMMFPVIRIDGEIYVGTEELKEWVHQAVSLKKEYDLKL